MSNLLPEHIAIIMDGNGRWAKKRGLPRTAGHKKGAETIREIAIACNKRGIKALTCYAFSTENWKRPDEEVNYLCKLPKLFFDAYMKELMENNIKTSFIGEIEAFPQETRDIINRAVEKTKDNTGLELVFALNYGGQREIVLAAQKYAQDCLDGRDNDLTCEEFEKYLFTKDLPAIDLMIRTSGEVRLSNFLLYQLAYAEFIFTDVAWPDFDDQALQACLDEYASRNRRYGGV